MQRVVLLGYGAIGRAVHLEIARLNASGSDLKSAQGSANAPPYAEIIGLWVRDRKSINMEGFDLPASTAIVDSLEDAIALKPDLVVECAGHSAVDQFGAAILRMGSDLMMVSIGAMAEKQREQSLREAAHISKRQLTLPAGAIGAIDWLVAARYAGLSKVTLRSTKPPGGWVGTAAEKRVNLVQLSQATPVFQGSARQAALIFPANANVAATIALAGLGFDDTQVELIADPALSANEHCVEAVSNMGSMTITVQGRTDPSNPKTSVSTAFSVVRAILNRNASIVI